MGAGPLDSEAGIEPVAAGKLAGAKAGTVPLAAAGDSVPVHA